MTGQIFSLTSDFGLKDPYVAEMKAVILSLHPKACIVDIAHEVEKFSIRVGAYMLASASPYFPEQTIHVAVVDPGVGTERRAIIIQTKRSYFVGPDNGLLILAAEAEGIKQVHEIAARRLMLPHVSNTFHGRDVFAPAAAHLANGVAIGEFGPEIRNYVKPSFAEVKREKDGLFAEVLHVDGFGNVVTNIHASDLRHYDGVYLQLELPSGNRRLRLSKTYSGAKPHEALALMGSQNYLEFAVNQGNASEELQIKSGDKIKLIIS